MTSWLDIAEAAMPRSEQMEEAGHVSADIVGDLAATGVFKLWVDPAYDGGGATLQEGLDAIEGCAYFDGAIGWSVMIANTTALLSTRLHPETAAEIFGPPDAIAGGFAAPIGVAELDGDVATVTGRWAWGSGSSHATTMGGGIRYVDADGEPAPGPDNSRSGFAFFQPDDVTLLDTWHVAGLEATASTDYEVRDAQVPARRIAPLDRRAPFLESHLSRFSTFGALALGVGAVALGLARRAADELVLLADKMPQGSSRRLSERPVAQAELARAEGARRAALEFVRAEVGRCWERVLTGAPLEDHDKLALRLAANHAMETAVTSVDRCFHTAGGAAVYRDHPMQRVFRDVHVAAQHAMTAARVYEPIGRARFGLETDTRTL